MSCLLEPVLARAATATTEPVGINRAPGNGSLCATAHREPLPAAHGEPLPSGAGRAVPAHSTETISKIASCGPRGRSAKASRWRHIASPAGSPRRQRRNKQAATSSKALPLRRAARRGVGRQKGAVSMDAYCPFLAGIRDLCTTIGPAESRTTPPSSLVFSHLNCTKAFPFQYSP